MRMIRGVAGALLVVGAVPFWRYSRKWGYGPSGLMGLLLVLVVALMAAEVIPRAF